jgi:hypothetical protein
MQILQIKYNTKYCGWDNHIYTFPRKAKLEFAAAYHKIPQLKNGVSKTPVYHGLPNLFLPLIIAVGESRNGEPLAFVAIPPGR